MPTIWGMGDYYYEDGYLPPLPDTEGDEEVSDDMMQMEISTQIPSVTINPVSHLKVSGYFRVAPSYSMLVASEELYHGYGTFFTLGGSVSFKIISIGIEGRWGNTKYNNIDLGNLEDEEYWDEDASMGDMLKERMYVAMVIALAACSDNPEQVEVGPEPDPDPIPEYPNEPVVNEKVEMVSQMVVGFVRDADGTALSGVTVTTGNQRIMTDNNGFFLFPRNWFCK